MDVKLVVFKPNGDRKDITLPKGEVLIGRQKDAQLRLPLPSVSRRHAEIVHTDDSVTIRDLGSSNGTYCNDEKLDAEHTLRAGDVVSVGPIRFTVQIDGLPASIQAAAPPPPPDLSETPPAPSASPPPPAAAATTPDDDDDDDGDLDETVTKTAGLGGLLGENIEESSVFDFDFEFDEDDNPKL